MDKLDEKIIEERWAEFDARLTGRLEILRGERVALEAFDEPSVDNIQSTFELLEHAPVLYMRQSHEEKAKLLRTLVSNCKLKDGIIEPVYKKPFDSVAVGVQTGNWLGEEDSNPH